MSELADRLVKAAALLEQYANAKAEYGISTHWPQRVQTAPKAFAALRAVLDLADSLDKDATDMMWVGGESPRPQDYSEGHYVGVMNTQREAAEKIRTAISKALEGS